METPLNRFETSLLRVLGSSYFLGPVNIAAGTAADPALVFDTGTGFYTSGTDEVTYVINGTQFAVLKAAGRLELGETPALGPNLPLLTLQRTANTTDPGPDIEIINPGSGSGRLYIETEGTTATKARALIVHSYGTGFPGNWWTAGPTIANSIGLQEDRNASYAQTAQVVFQMASQNNYYRTSTSSLDWYFVRGTTTSGHFTDGHWQVEDGTKTIPSYSWISDTDTGIYRSASNTIKVSSGDTDCATFANTGVLIQGSTTNDNAAAGYVGEEIRSAVTATNFPTTNQWGDLTSVSLTAGNWIVSCVAYLTPGGGTTTSVNLGISTTSGNSSTGLTLGDNFVSLDRAALVADTLSIPAYRMTFTTTTTVYFKYLATYSSGTPQARGRISAVRPR